MKTILIAEIGPNHNGDLGLAYEQVAALSRTAVSYVKFQLAVPENVYSLDAFKASYQIENDGNGSVIEMSKRVQLNFDEHKQLKKFCDENEMKYLCTAFDIESLEFIDRELDVEMFKIASGEMLSTDMLEYMSRREKPIIMSTGMATYDEVKEALDILEWNGEKDITLLHCTSVYPCTDSMMNLGRIGELRKRFGKKVGLSDHSEDCLAASVAVGQGIDVLEKHVTSSRDLRGPDHKMSLPISEVDSLIRVIERSERMMERGEKDGNKEEAAIARMARKSIVTRRDIRVGEKIEKTDLVFKRPGWGYKPTEIGEIIGKRAGRDLERDRVVTKEDIL